MGNVKSNPELGNIPFVEAGVCKSSTMSDVFTHRWNGRNWINDKERLCGNTQNV